MHVHNVSVSSVQPNTDISTSSLAPEQETLKKIRWMLGFFIFGLVVSGVTAIPLQQEVRLLASWFGADSTTSADWNFLQKWLATVQTSLDETAVRHPLLFYGTDWLAFGHLMIALVFVGPWRDPIKNIWVIQFGMLACILVIPWALIFGQLRDIPFFWRLIDCSFGLIGIIPLWLSNKLVHQLIKIRAV